MTHTHARLYYHIVWSTKGRLPLLLPKFQERLYQYIGGILKNLDCSLLEIGGVQDHIHLLLYIKPDTLLSDVMRQVKSRSTKWISSEIQELRDFSWQEGYGAFSVSFSMVQEVQKYIKNQKEHHKKMTYEEEYLLFLKKHAIEYDPRFVFG